ncbi:hypothetical protein H3C61_00965 [Candidatus Gracilibacteria bacterium]|nr:hypothetical protein [Candidatus Gracilibacteria bacterium]
MIHFLWKISFWTHIIRISLIIAMLWSIFEGNWAILFVIILTFLFTYIHLVFKKYDIIIPQVFQFIIIFFIYSSLFLGDINEFYYLFPWWDIVLHSFSGIALGFIGFLIPYTFYKIREFKAPPIMIVLFGFCFAVTLGTLWEITEFILDSFFNLNMQKARDLVDINGIINSREGVKDTMNDLVLDTLGAFFASVFGYFYLVGGEKSFIYKKLIEIFEKSNNYFEHKKEKFFNK